jgi:hypothetical protein
MVIERFDLMASGSVAVLVEGGVTVRVPVFLYLSIL